MLTSTAEDVRRTAVAVLSSLGDSYARRLLREGLAAAAAPVRRNWARSFALAQSDPLDIDLLSQYCDSIGPWLDPRATVDTQHVRRMARLVGLDAADVRRRYARLATIAPLRLASP